MSTRELLIEAAAKRGHEAEADERFGFPTRSGRYRVKCVNCGMEVNYYEGMWGSAMDNDCPKKGESSET